MTIKILAKNKVKLKKKLWDIFSAYIRIEASDDNGYLECITCDAVKLWNDGMQAGHYYHDKSLPLHFCERNVHGQCVKCNHFKDGNRDEYALFLEKEYGMGILQELIALDKPIPQGHFWLEAKIEEYREKLKQVKEERGVE